MDRTENQSAAAIKPKRGRGRPPGTKNSAKKSKFENGVAIRTPTTKWVTKEQSHGSTYNCGSSTDLSIECNMLNVTPQNNLERIFEPMERTNFQQLSSIDVEETCAEGQNQNLPSVQDYSHSSTMLKPEQVNLANFNFLACQNPAAEVPQSKISNAVDYVNTLKLATSGDKSHLYVTYLQLMEDYKRRKIDVRTLISEINATFSGYPELLLGFQSYLVDSDSSDNIMYEAQQHSDGACFLPREPDSTTESVSTEQEGNYVASISDQSLLEEVVLELPPQSTDQVPEGTMVQATSGFNRNVLLPSDVHEAENLNDMALLALNLHQQLEARLGKDTPNYKILSHALSTLYEDRKRESDGNADDFEEAHQQRLEAFEVVRDILKDEPDLLAVVEAFFTSEKTFPGLPYCMSMTPVDTEASSHVSNVVTYVPENEVSPTTTEPESTYCQFQVCVPVITLDGDEDEVPEPEPLPEPVKNAHDNGLLSLSPNVLLTRVKESKVFANVLDNLSTSQDLFMCNQNELASMVEMKLMGMPQLFFDERRWITELCDTLCPNLMKINSLRCFICHNLGVTFLKLNNGNADQQTEEENTRGDNSCENDSDDAEVSNGSRETYNIRPDTYLHLKPPSRAALYDEVLNDKYFSVSHRKKFKLNDKTREEERLNEYEDARYEVDMLVHRSSRTIDVIKKLQVQISEMNQTELDGFQLDDELGGSSIVHKQTVQMLYSQEHGELILEGLKKFPTLFVPGVLIMMSVRYKEWIELQGRWNMLISADQKKFMAKWQRKSKFESKRFILKSTRRLR